MRPRGAGVALCVRCSPERVPYASFGPKQTARIRCPPKEVQASLAWVRDTEDTVGRAWKLAARRLHRQALKAGQAMLVRERRLAHRRGHTSQWLHLLVGSSSPSFPAALEAPSALSPEARVSSATKFLVEKYGTRC